MRKLNSEVIATTPTDNDLASADGRPVHHKVGMLAAVLTAMLVLVGAIGASAVRSMRSDLGALVQREGRLMTELNTVEQLLLNAQLNMERSSVMPLDTRLEMAPEIEQQVRDVLTYAQLIPAHPNTPDVSDLSAATEDWLAAAAVVMDGLDDPTAPDVVTLRSEFEILQAELTATITPLTQDVTGRANSAIDRAQLYFQILVAAAALGVVAGVLASRSTYRATQVQHEEIERRHRERAREAATSRAHARIAQALEFSATESDALEAAGRALEELFPGRPTELILADSSRAHFAVGLRSATNGDHGCRVASPRACPAVARGQTLVFGDSERFEACAYLRGRPCGPLSAVCVPVSIGGSAEGVLHSVGPQGEAIDPVSRQLLEHIAARCGDRIGSVRAFDRSETQAATDPLTGLANRRSFEDHVGTMLRSGRAVTIAFGDIDHFKLLNDTHGHGAGDRALRALARVMREVLRPGDMAARWGGEEFVIAFPATSKADTVGALERLRADVVELGAGGTVPAFTISFGVADGDDGADLEAIVAAADRALLTAKRGGRNRVLLASSGTEAEAGGEPAERQPEDGELTGTPAPEDAPAR